MFRRSTQGAVELIHGTVPLTRNVQEEFRSVAQSCVASGPGQVVLDLREVTLIDSAGLESLLDLQETCLRRGGALKVAAPNHLCRDILRVTGLDEQIESYSDVVSAVGSFAG